MTVSPERPPAVMLRTPRSAWLLLTWLGAAGVPAVAVYLLASISEFPTGFWSGLATFGWMVIGPVGTAFALRRCLQAAEQGALTRPSIVKIFAETAGKWAVSLAVSVGIAFGVVVLFGGGPGGALGILLIAALLGIPAGLIIAVPLGALSGAIASWIGYTRSLDR